MSVVNGQDADQTTFNNAFASKTQDNTLTGVQNFQNSGSTNVDDVQSVINTNLTDIATAQSDITALQATAPTSDEKAAFAEAKCF